MAINLESLTKGAETKPPRILITGTEGCGKTTFASRAPNPVFLMTDEGTGKLDITRWKIKSFDEMMEGLGILATEDHDFQTAVIDSVDWLEPEVFEKVCQLQQVDNIESIGYGKGYNYALDQWREYLSALDYLRNERNMIIIQIAHTQVKRYESPETDSYDRYTIKLNEKAGRILSEHSDCVFFCNYKTFLKEDKNAPGKKGEKRALAVGDSTRYLYTERRPAFDAKNRYDLPHEIPLNDKTWDVLSQHIPFLQKL